MSYIPVPALIENSQLDGASQPGLTEGPVQGEDKEAVEGILAKRITNMEELRKDPRKIASLPSIWQQFLYTNGFSENSDIDDIVEEVLPDGTRRVRTALLFAVASGLLGLVKILLDHGADANKPVFHRNNEGVTTLITRPLDVMNFMDNFSKDILNALIKKGASYCLLSKEYLTGFRKPDDTITYEFDEFFIQIRMTGDLHHGVTHEQWNWRHRGFLAELYGKWNIDLPMSKVEQQALANNLGSSYPPALLGIIVSYTRKTLKEMLIETNLWPETQIHDQLTPTRESILRAFMFQAYQLERTPSEVEILTNRLVEYGRTMEAQRHENAQLNAQVAQLTAKVEQLQSQEVSSLPKPLVQFSWNRTSTLSSSVSAATTATSLPQISSSSPSLQPSSAKPLEPFVSPSGILFSPGPSAATISQSLPSISRLASPPPTPENTAASQATRESDFERNYRNLGF